MAHETLRDGRYVLVRPLGEGSQAETHEAVDKRDGRLVAIKCFRVAKARAWKDVELAEREAKTLASLDHPALPKYVEHFEENGALYLVMEKIEGESVAALRRSGRRWTTPEVTRMLDDLDGVLAYLQRRAPPIIHRDIKPANVIRRADGSFALVDFGSVRDKLQPAGGSTVVGTFGYMAPEQFQGRATLRSDVYGVAATALAMLTATEPEDLPHQGLAIDVERAVPRGTPRALVRALGSMLDPDPDKRASIDHALRGVRAGAARDPRRRGKREKREAERERKRDRDAKRKARRAARASRGPRAPFVPRLIARLALLVATLVVWIAVGLVTPLVLVLLSLVFGSALRRAASACMRAAKHAGRAMTGASIWLSGGSAEEETEPSALAEGDEPARPRVAVPVRVQAVTPEQAQAIAIAEAEAAAEAATEAWAAEQRRAARKRG